MKKTIAFSLLALVCQLALANNTKKFEQGEITITGYGGQARTSKLNDREILNSKLHIDDTITLIFTKDLFIEKGTKDVVMKSDIAECRQMDYLVRLKEAKRKNRIIKANTPLEVTVYSHVKNGDGLVLVPTSNSEVLSIYLKENFGPISVGWLKHIIEECNTGLAITDVEFTGTSQAEIIR